MRRDPFAKIAFYHFPKIIIGGVKIINAMKQTTSLFSLQKSQKFIRHTHSSLRQPSLT